jgi:N-acetylmuramoyl-L-alanine amidase
VIACLVSCFFLLAAPAPTAPMLPPPAPLAGLTVSLDPGHNPRNARHATRINREVQAGPIRKACDTTGAATRDGYPEWRFNQQLATRVARRLRAHGATVRFTRTQRAPAWGPCITERARRGNQADVAVSLHADGNMSAAARGFHVIRPAFVRGYTGDITRRSATLATAMRDSLVRRGKLRPSTYIGRRGLIARRDLGGLVLSDVPKVFVEAGNLRHPADAALLRSARGQERIAAAICDALLRWHAAEVAAGG